MSYIKYLVPDEPKRDQYINIIWISRSGASFSGAVYLLSDGYRSLIPLLQKIKMVSIPHRYTTKSIDGHEYETVLWDCLSCNVDTEAARMVKKVTSKYNRQVSVFDEAIATFRINNKISL